MCRVLAVTTVYNPDAENVRSNVLRYIDHVDTLLIWDNTPNPDKESSRLGLEDSFGSKIVRMATGKNEGIAYAVNHGIGMALEGGYDLMLIMDQDSVWENFAEYIMKVKSLFRQGRGGIFVPNISGRESPGEDVVEKPHFINAGTVFDVKRTFPVLGSYNEKLFVDGLDLDYSIRANMAGIKILALTNCRLKQQYGNPVKSEFWGCASNNYPSLRTYNIVKNHILIWRKYGRWMPADQKKLIVKGYILKRYAKIILLEQDKFGKMKSLTKGIFHGITAPLSSYFPQDN